MAEPQTRKRGRNIFEQGVKALAVLYIRRRIGVAAVTAAGRREKAVEMKRQWRIERQDMAIAAKLGHTSDQH